MELEDDVFLHLPFKDVNDQHDVYNTNFPVMPSQGSNFGALYLNRGPWITQNMDMAQPLSKSAHTSSAAQLESNHSRDPRKGPLPSVRQRTAQACDKCRARKTKCSGHRPVCLRCTTRGLACEYSARLRLPTRTRFHPGYNIRPETVLSYQTASPSVEFVFDQ